MADYHSIDFWRWWNSTGEIKSIDVLNKNLAELDINWKDKTAKSKSTDTYLSSFNEQLKNQLPDAAMMVTSKIYNYDTKFSLM